MRAYAIIKYHFGDYALNDASRYEVVGVYRDRKAALKEYNRLIEILSITERQLCKEHNYDYEEKEWSSGMEFLTFGGEFIYLFFKQTEIIF